MDLSKIILLLLLSPTLLHALSNSQQQQTLPFEETLIQQACLNTADPATCISRIHTECQRGGRGPLPILHAAVRGTINEALRARETVSGFTAVSDDLREQTAIEDCMELLGHTVDELSWSLSEVSRLESGGTMRRDANLRTWMSAAFSNQDTCLEGFHGTDGRLKHYVSPSMRQVTQLVSNLLEMCRRMRGILPHNKSNNDNRRKNDTLPSWIGEEEERLMRAEVASMQVDAVVAQDGTGRYRTVNEAVNGAPSHSGRRYVILVKNGVYKENVELKKKKNNIMIVGEGMGQTVITGSRNFRQGWTTFRTATFDKISRQEIRSVGQVQSMQLESDLVVSENPPLSWPLSCTGGVFQKFPISEGKSLPAVSNVRGKSDSSVARGMMSGSPSRALGRLVWIDVRLDESVLDDGGGDRFLVEHSGPIYIAVSGLGFIARDITFRNTAGPQNHQAVALRVDSDRSAFFRCSIEGYQDTLYAHSLRQFFRECHIYGTIDFIFGNGQAVFQSCKIYTRQPLPDQKVTITAQGRKDPKQNTGFSIHNSFVYATYPTYLGRPWKAYSRTVFMTTYLSDQVQPAGWLEWYGSFGLGTLFYGEYKNYGPGAGLRGRVRWPGYHVIQDAAVASFFTVRRFIDGSSWLPATGVPFTADL